jgi:hypothetical protein
LAPYRIQYLAAAAESVVSIAKPIVGVVANADNFNSVVKFHNFVPFKLTIGYLFKLTQSTILAHLDAAFIIESVPNAQSS